METFLYRTGTSGAAQVVGEMLQIYDNGVLVNKLVTMLTGTHQQAQPALRAVS